jgi:hypothetical protein
MASKTGARSPGEALMTPSTLRGGGLLIQRLARLGDEPRIFHRNHGLRREVPQQRDLLVGERPHLLPISGDRSEQLALFSAGDSDVGTNPT